MSANLYKNRILSWAVLSICLHHCCQCVCLKTEMYKERAVMLQHYLIKNVYYLTVYIIMWPNTIGSAESMLCLFWYIHLFQILKTTLKSESSESLANPSKYPWWFHCQHYSCVDGQNLKIAAKLRRSDCNVSNHVIRVDVRLFFFFFFLTNSKCLILEQQFSDIKAIYYKNVLV